MAARPAVGPPARRPGRRLCHAARGGCRSGRGLRRHPFPCRLAAPAASAAVADAVSDHLARPPRFPDVSLAMQTVGDAPFVSISQSQRIPLPGLNWLATIHHGMPSDLLTLSRQPEGYLAFLGRITPEKGPDIAIRVARAAGLA